MSEDGDDDDVGERFGDDEADDSEELFAEFNDTLFLCRFRLFMLRVGLIEDWFC